MSKVKLDGEARVSEYFVANGLRVERFTKADLRHGRTPDFKVFSGDELAFYCEVKTSQEEEWLELQQAGAASGALVDASRPDPTYNRLSNYINNAVEQLDSVNSAMDHPNVLAIVNGDTGAGFTDLIQVLTGNAYCESGTVIPMFRKFSEGRILQTKMRVHLFLWFNEWQKREPSKFFPEVHPNHHAALCRHFNVDPDDLRRLRIPH